MSSEAETPVCESCGQAIDDAKSMVVIMASQGQELVRHRRCRMLELLERA
jgi:predicted RNA-binding Zn-ribbon protein involved in translation (DUF1610 family)